MLKKACKCYIGIYLLADILACIFFFQNSTRMIMLKSPSDLAVFRGEREIIECNSNDPSAQYIWYVPKKLRYYSGKTCTYLEVLYITYMYFIFLKTICPLFSQIKTMMFAMISMLPEN